MNSVSVRELNQHTARVLERVSESGKPLTVTLRGEPRWEIAPASMSDDSPIDRAIREGRATAPLRDLPLPSEPLTAKSGLTVDQLLAEMEEDH
jgi:prevent-host-death family protein